MNRSRLVSLFSAVLLLFAGAETAVMADDRVVGSMLMAAGLIVLGAWIALEVTAEWPRRKQDDDDDQASGKQ